MDKAVVQFKKSVKKRFGSLLEYAFLSGRYSYGVAEKRKSDIDCIVVLDDAAYKIKIIDGIFGFCEDYLNIHKELCFKPDLFFPGDVISHSQKEESITGRGFEIFKGRLYCSLVLSDEDWDKLDMDYRVWRSELAFNNNCFIAGDYNSFINDRHRSVEVILKYLALNGNIKLDNNPKEIVLAILNSGKSLFGIDRHYGAEFVSDLTKLISSTDRNFKLENLKQWESELVNKLETGEICKSNYLYKWKDLREYVKRIISEQK